MFISKTLQNEEGFIPNEILRITNNGCEKYMTMPHFVQLNVHSTTFRWNENMISTSATLKYSCWEAGVFRNKCRFGPLNSFFKGELETEIGLTWQKPSSDWIHCNKEKHWCVSWWSQSKVNLSLFWTNWRMFLSMRSIHGRIKNIH